MFMEKSPDLQRYPVFFLIFHWVLKDYAKSRRTSTYLALCLQPLKKQKTKKKNAEGGLKFSSVFSAFRKKKKKTWKAASEGGVDTWLWYGCGLYSRVIFNYTLAVTPFKVCVLRSACPLFLKAAFEGWTRIHEKEQSL